LQNPALPAFLFSFNKLPLCIENHLPLLYQDKDIDPLKAHPELMTVVH